jgi:mRNA-degrading endonuclease RelE of RelBE toxin-antitoxin system
MKYEVSFTGGALRDLEALPTAIAWAVIAFCDGPLAENPKRVGKALRNQLAGLHSARRGEYRIIYRIDELVITVDVIRIRHRSRAYRGQGM